MRVQALQLIALLSMKFPDVQVNSKFGLPMPSAAPGTSTLRMADDGFAVSCTCVFF